MLTLYLIQSDVYIPSNDSNSNGLFIYTTYIVQVSWRSHDPYSPWAMLQYSGNRIETIFNFVLPKGSFYAESFA